MLRRLETPRRGSRLTIYPLVRRRPRCYSYYLLESDAPLVIDQPEDDLDNRFITEVVVPKMGDEKRRRQFIFSTHNANIPVLGDAELISQHFLRSEREESSSPHAGRPPPL